MVHYLIDDVFMNDLVFNSDGGQIGWRLTHERRDIDKSLTLDLSPRVCKSREWRI